MGLLYTFYRLPTKKAKREVMASSYVIFGMHVGHTLKAPPQESCDKKYSQPLTPTRETWDEHLLS